ncbi:MAG: beta-Ala-His dipeptidase [Desulfomonilia bacterium]
MQLPRIDARAVTCASGNRKTGKEILVAEAIEGLSPEALWRYFWEISQIPRESGKEDRIRDFVTTRARSLGHDTSIDIAGNVIVRKQGKTGHDPVALQSHMDMVCEKNTDTVHDFEKDPISLLRTGDWITARGTTLGADNGIGMAAMLAIMEDLSLDHPPLELVFTVDEETGLTGARMLTRDSLFANTLINLDSEEVGCFTIGCAGGLDSRLVMDLNTVEPCHGDIPIRITVTGLKGGHSGINIHEGLGNAIKFIARFLRSACRGIPYQLVRINGGSKHNAIPREAEALLLLKPGHLEKIEDASQSMNETLCQEYTGVEENITIQVVRETESHHRVIDEEDAQKVLDLLMAIPHGALRITTDMGGVVITSTNLAMCVQDGSSFTIITSQRSIIPSAIEEIASQINAVGCLGGARVIHEHGYPAWRPNYRSEILKTCTDLYRTMYCSEPKVKVIHAGLECAVIGEQISGLDMISFGPKIMNAHSPSEMVEIPSVETMWTFLVSLLKNMAEK